MAHFEKLSFCSGGNLWVKLKPSVNAYAAFDYISDTIWMLKKNFMAPFYGWGSTPPRLQSHLEEAVYFIPLSS